MNINRQTILLMVDNKTDRLLLNQLLEESAYDVKMVNGTFLAEEWLESSIIITDELYANRFKEDLLTIKHQSGSLFVPLIILLPQDRDSSPWLKSGFDEVLRLPLQKKEFIDRLHALARLRSLSEAQCRLIFEDITQRKLAEEALQLAEKQIKFMAFHDPLTGLINRARLEISINQLLKVAEWQEKHVVVIFLDLNRFKAVNDALGHLCGDMLLCEVADRLKKTTRPVDIIARLAGDEFIIVMADIDNVAKVTQLINTNIIQVLSEPYILNQHTLHITASMGISIYPTDGEDAASLIKNADIALNYAKEIGENNYQFCTPAMTKHLEQKTSLEEKITMEITESILFQDIKNKMNAIQKLKHLGMKISIDDFGTGYSSLNYLRHFIIDSLKIDLSFIRDLTTDPDDALIVKTIISMAHNLNIKVIAEGVETEEQLQLLKDYQCDEAQGFYFSKAIPELELTKYIRSM